MAKESPFARLAPFCYLQPGAVTLDAATQVHGQLLLQGMFLPPLLVLDVLSVLQVGGSRSLTPPAFHRRRSSAGWAEFLLTLARRAMLSRGADARHALRVLQSLADNVAHVIETHWDGASCAAALRLGSARLVEAEAHGLSGVQGAAPGWAAIWDYLDRSVASEEGRDGLLPFSASFRAGGDGKLLPILPNFDPQLDQLVQPVDFYRSEAELMASPLPRGQDSGPRRHYAGDFLERAPGPLPRNLSEISPSDLVLVAPVHGAERGLSRAMRLRFALKAGEGDIHQRYHSQLEPGVMGRRLSVRIRMMDVLESRDLVQRVGGYLPVSLYRATSVFFLHHLAQLLMHPNRPECQVVLELGNGSGKLLSRRLPDDFHRAASISPRRCAEVVWACLPAFFSVSHPSHLATGQEGRASGAEDAVSIDLLLGARGQVWASPSGDNFVVEVTASAHAQALIPRLLLAPDSDAQGALGACEPEEAHHLGRQLVDLIARQAVS